MRCKIADLSRLKIKPLTQAATLTAKPWGKIRPLTRAEIKPWGEVAPMVYRVEGVNR